MEFIYLGTGAAEGIPAIFCNCKVCKEAQRLGGRNIRTRSQALVNRDLLFDFPPDSYLHKVQYDLDLFAVQYLIITHKHMDHFFPQEFDIHGGVFSHNLTHEWMNIYCAQEVRDYYYRVTESDESKDEEKGIRWHILKPFDTVQAGPYRVTAIPASHMKEGNEPFIYHLVDEEGKSVLYLHDSGYYKEEVWDYFERIAKENGPVDLVSLDATDGVMETDHSGHMAFPEGFRVQARMKEIGLIGEKTHCVFNHFSHNGKYLYEEMVQVATPHNVQIAYDGMKIVL